MFKWVEGRQGSGYFKMKLFESIRFRFDCYLLKFEKGVSVPWHRDYVENGRHYRLNITLWKGKGGEVITKYKPLLKLPRIMLFRPDWNCHCMTEVTEGKAIMLSIGKVNG